MKRNECKSLGNLAVLLFSLALPAHGAGAQASWTQIQANGTAGAHQPLARSGHSMSTWGTRGVILFGGRSVQGNFDLNDTWFWDGTRWNFLTFANSPPPAREGALMAYDADHD